MSKKKKTIKKNSKQTYMEKKTAIAGILRDRKTSPKKERKKVNLSLKQITVKNAEGDPDTTATILVQNQIDYVPKVSVIIPVYNVEEYLRECLDSVVNQTLKDIEIICVDDGSTDSSLEILKEYAQKDKRFTIITQKNLHAGVARNAGLSQAKSEYIHFLDSDDWVEREIYIYSINEMDRSGADVYLFNYNDYDMISHRTQLHQPYSAYKNKFYFKKYTDILRRPVVPWNKIYRHSFIKNQDLKFDATIVANDRTFYFKMLFKNPLMLKTSYEGPLLNYRINNSKSLVGEKRLRNFNSHFISFERSRKACLSAYSNLVIDIIDLFMQDCIYFYKKANNEQKISLQNILYTYFTKEKDVFDSFDFKKYSWYPYYMQIKAKDRIIPIVFATNNKYAPFVNVTIQSILDNSDTNYFYNCYIFYDNLDKNLIQLKFQNYENVNIYFIDVSSYIRDNHLYSRAHYSTEMYYRMLIPELLPQYDKVLYLDCDLIVLHNIVDLYQINLGNNFVGATNNYCNEKMESYVKKLQLDPYKYFNSGVLLINNIAWNNLDLRKRCFELAEKYKELVCPDQDILNIICKDNILWFSNQWNFTWQHLFNKQMGWPRLSQKAQQLYDKHCNDFYIIHYTSGLKPWNKKTLKYANLWWKYARKINSFKRQCPIRIDKLMAYLIFPYYYLKIKVKKLQYLPAIVKSLTRYRIDIKNLGSSENRIKFTTQYKDAKITSPLWFSDSKGQGQIFEENNLKQKINFSIVKDGILSLAFKAKYIELDKRHYPLWIDYKSIKIDGKEILSAPISTWHDKPYCYEMTVKDGQKISLEIEQQYHQYAEDELKNTILSVCPRFEYILTNIKQILQKLKRYFPIIDEETYHKRCLDEKVIDIIKFLTRNRIDIRNCRDKNNSVIVETADSIVEFPKWFEINQGVGCLVTNKNLIQKINVTAVKSGTLKLEFKAPNKTIGGERYPLWIDYKSIKIDGREILFAPISTWHDKPYRYEMPVKDGQEITLEVEQQPHQYLEEELRDLIFKLYPNNEYIKDDIKVIVDKIQQTMGGYSTILLDTYPKITTDCFIPLGIACRPAFWIKKYNLRYCSLPFDWMMNFPLNTILSTIKNGIKSWFNHYIEDKEKKSIKKRYVTDTENHIISMHGFPIEKTVDEYMPEFKEIFGRRCKRFTDILSTVKDICFICNRNDSISDLMNLVCEIRNNYPQLNITMLNIRHSKETEKITANKIDNKAIVYDIEAYDVHKNGNDKSNPSFWIGNEDLWNKICGNLSLSNTTKEKLKRIEKDNVI